MQQSPFVGPEGHQAGGAAPKRPAPLITAALVGGGVAALVAFAFFARFMAQRQEAACVAAIGAATTAVGAADDAKAASAVQAAHAKCRSARETEVAALDQALAERAGASKTRSARPALLAAGYKPEQLDRLTMAPVCKARGFMVVEMVASNVTGEPHSFDCDRSVLWQTTAQSREECAARKLDHTTTTDESGTTVGACKRHEDPIEVACGVARSFTPQYVVRSRQRLDFATVPRLKVLVSVPLGLSREQLEANLRHALLAAYEETGVPLGAVTVSAWKSENLAGAYSAGTATLAPAGEWKDANPRIPLDRWSVQASLVPGYFDAKSGH